MSEIHDKVANDIERFGGKLVCETCGKEKHLRDAGRYLANGWPMCCGLTIRWFTAKELEAESHGTD